MLTEILPAPQPTWKYRRETAWQGPQLPSPTPNRKCRQPSRSSLKRLPQLRLQPHHVRHNQQRSMPSFHSLVEGLLPRTECQFEKLLGIGRLPLFRPKSPRQLPLQHGLRPFHKWNQFPRIRLEDNPTVVVEPLNAPVGVNTSRVVGRQERSLRQRGLRTQVHAISDGIAH